MYFLLKMGIIQPAVLVYQRVFVMWPYMPRLFDHSQVAFRRHLWFLEALRSPMHQTGSSILSNFNPTSVVLFIPVWGRFHFFAYLIFFVVSGPSLIFVASTTVIFLILSTFYHAKSIRIKSPFVYMLFFSFPIIFSKSKVVDFNVLFLHVYPYLGHSLLSLTKLLETSNGWEPQPTSMRRVSDEMYVDSKILHSKLNRSLFRVSNSKIGHVVFFKFMFGTFLQKRQVWNTKPTASIYSSV